MRTSPAAKSGICGSNTAGGRSGIQADRIGALSVEVQAFVLCKMNALPCACAIKARDN
jgi:hypothetical protein